MRPKIVILTLVVAFGLLAIVALMKGVGNKNTGSAGGQAPTVEVGGNPQAAGTNDQLVGVNANSSNLVAKAEQIRAAGIAAELDTIQDILGQAAGTNNPTVIAALIDKVANPEAEVRKAAVDALIQLNDTNAVPGLQLAAEAIKDPREKVAVMDAIDYLKLPSIMQDVSPDSLTNSAADSNIVIRPRPVKNVNPKAQRGRRHNAQPQAPANPNVGQPQ